MLAFGNIIRLSAIVKGGLIVALLLFLLIFRYLYRRRYEAAISIKHSLRLVMERISISKAKEGSDLKPLSSRGSALMVLIKKGIQATSLKL